VAIIQALNTAENKTQQSNNKEKIVAIQDIREFNI
jgi:hypothetical protein